MKKMIFIALLMAGTASFAQEKPRDKKPPMEQFTPAQRNELRLKKMTLELGLNASQQKEMGQIIAEQGEKMEARKAEWKAQTESKVKPTADARFAKQSKMLDEQIAMNERVKKILTPEQFEKWQNRKEDMHRKMKAHDGKPRMRPEDK